MSKIPTGETAVTSHVTLGKNETGQYKLGVKLEVQIPGVDNVTAGQLIAKAHEVCPYSHATRGNIDVEIVLVD